MDEHANIPPPSSPATPLRTWRALGLELPLGASERELERRASQALGFGPEEVSGMRIARKALDARRRGSQRDLHFVCHVDLIVRSSRKPQALRRALQSGRALEPEPPARVVDGVPAALWRSAGTPPVVILGSGPAGLFAAFVLAEWGVPALVLERGSALRPRGRKLAAFLRRRELDPECNLLFGEGGAGTYSDGKIYTRVNDPLEIPLLEELVRCGAQSEILYDSLAHIGTDRLHKLLPVLRAGLERRGVRFEFDTRVEGLVLAPASAAKRAVAVRTSRGELACSAVLVACGHSARDTWRWLARVGLAFEAKPFQLGLRIEHPQELIDRGRFGGPVHELGAAGYNLIAREQAGARAAFTFCMCPGGRIVASANEPGLLCTNGMSNSRHSSGWASSAVVTTIEPADFGAAGAGADPFAGVALQRELEARFFQAGGGDWTAPAQAADDFLLGRASSRVRRSTWPFGTRPQRLDRLLPPLVRAALARALERFERQIPGFSGPEGLLVGLESRSSGPVRMPRVRESRAAVGFANVYPLGEGAGYAGGIMSAALDGAHCARALARAGPVS
jgi:hypothetical protein